MFLLIFVKSSTYIESAPALYKILFSLCVLEEFYNCRELAAASSPILTGGVGASYDEQACV